MNNTEIDYLKFKLNELKRLNLSCSITSSHNNGTLRLHSKYLKHLNYYRKYWLFENNPVFDNGKTKF